MQQTLHLAMAAQDWLALFLHYLMLSPIAIGGAIAMSPDMHRFLVEQQHWLTDAQFNSSITIAQAAPGPNVLFIALMGWNIGLNAGGMLTGLLGLALTMSGILIPSSVLTFITAQWAQRNRHLRAVRAFKQGMGPVVVALLVSTGWILAGANGRGAGWQQNWPAWLATAITALVVWRTRIHLLWLLGAGAVLGWFGLI